MMKTAFFCGVLVFFTVIQPVMAAPSADLWPRWQAHDAGSTKTIDHGAWAEFLLRYGVRSDDGVNRVRYGAVSPDDKSRLEQYLQRLQALPISKYSRMEQFAYWVNLYNARTVQLILDHYPVKSIRDIRFGWFSFGPWDEKLLSVESEKLSLNDIEHRILRPIWNDNRIHYAVNCASVGCPNLALVPFTAVNTEQLLDESARAYINHPRGVVITADTITASKIYDWYQIDFGNSENSLVEHWLKYAEPGLQKRLKNLDQSIDWEYEYDWSLNESS